MQLPESIQIQLERIKKDKLFDPLQIIAQFVDSHEERMDQKYLNDIGFTDPFKFYLLEEDEVSKCDHNHDHKNDLEEHIHNTKCFQRLATFKEKL